MDQTNRDMNIKYSMECMHILKRALSDMGNAAKTHNMTPLEALPEMLMAQVNAIKVNIYAAAETDGVKVDSDDLRLILAKALIAKTSIDAVIEAQKPDSPEKPETPDSLNLDNGPSVQA